jgi:hypothetical protein
MRFSKPSRHRDSEVAAHHVIERIVGTVLSPRVIKQRAVLLKTF